MGKPCFRVPLDGGGALGGAQRQAAMGTRPDADIIAVAPVDEIMTAFRARAGVVGHFIGRKAEIGGQILRQLVEFGAQIRVRHDQLARLIEVEEGRAFLDRQLIERQVIGGKFHRLTQLRLPAGHRLAGPGIDEVEGQAREGFAGNLDGLQRPGHVMQTAQLAQVLIIERLYAQRHTVDARRPVAAETFRLDAGGVGFQRDFHVRINRPVPGNRLQNALHRARQHQRWCAAAEEDRLHRPVRRPGSKMRQLPLEGRDKAVLIDRLVPDVGIEVAIGALGRAEGPVHIDAEAAVRGGGHSCSRQAFEKVTKARARCDRAGVVADQPCFSAEVISPKVRSWPSGWNIGS